MFPQIARGRKRAIEKCMPTWNLLFARAKKKLFLPHCAAYFYPFLSLTACVQQLCNVPFFSLPFPIFPEGLQAKGLQRERRKRVLSTGEEEECAPTQFRLAVARWIKKSLSLRFLLFSSSLSLSVFLSVSFEVNWMEKREAVLLRKMFIASSS